MRKLYPQVVGPRPIATLSKGVSTDRFERASVHSTRSPSLGDASAQEIVEVHDTDRPIRVDDDQRRNFRRIDDLQRLAG
jgi:hypothetical protein